MAESVRILMLEDNALDAELLLRQLALGQLRLEHRIVDGERAFSDALRDFAPHVILSDFSLPAFDGLTALQIAAKESPGTPFIFVSGTIGEERAIEALNRGAADYVLKDNLTRLVPAIQGALRQAEVTRERDLAEERLRAREARLRDIINTSNAWIWECDADRRCTFSSESCLRVLGYDHHAVLGRDIASYCHPSDAGSFTAAFEHLRSGGAEATQLPLRCRTKNGETRWIERDAVVVRDDEGVFRGLRGADRDITNRKIQELRIHRLNRALAFLGEANSALLRIRAREELLLEACRMAVRIGGYAAATIYLRPAEGDAPIIRRAVSEARIRPLAKESLDGVGQVARAVRTGLRVVDGESSAAGVELGLTASVALPLVLDKTPIGVLHLHAEEADVFGTEELDLLGQVTSNIAFALQYMQSKDAAKFLQYFDPITSLPKRALYLQRLAAELARRTHETLAVLVVDIKNLGVVNDSLGRSAGDLALQLVAERLKAHFSRTRCLGHLGGGTYALLQDGIVGGSDAASTLMANINVPFAEPFDLDEHRIQLSVRTGVALYPADAEEASALLNGAETALARAKQSGAAYLRHHASMNAQAAERLNLTNRLRQAVSQRIFQLHYQPKTSLASGCVEGVEALLRWRDDTGTFISPARFVPMLEAEGLIDEVGHWSVERALEETENWKNANGGPLTVAVNVSPMQFRSADFARNVLDLVKRPSERARLELEITESMLMDNIDATIAMLIELRDAGISIQIDDFGTGYSSLRVLSRLPVDALKIDRSFVSKLDSGVHDRSVVQTTISLANALGLKTIGEGVETKRQLDVLRELGCASVQGYLIRAPLPANELHEWLARTGGRLPSELMDEHWGLDSASEASA
jgi:diguanylate cyclase (GGDEF)-like protein/PAS domain S-box-containing protein